MSIINIVRKQEWVLLVGLTILVILLRLPSLEQPFDNDGGAVAYHARLISRNEPLYSSHHPDHHPPAVYYNYALAFFLFGDSVWSVKFLLVIWTVVIVYLIYRLGRLLMNRGMGVLAAIFYAILSSHILMWGTSAQTELFANLPRVAAVLLLLYLVAQKSSPWKYLFVGLLGAVAFLYKPHYLSPLILAGLILVVDLWQNRMLPGTRRINWLKLLWLGGGFILGLLPVVIYFGVLGLLPRLLLIFNLGLAYANRATTNQLGLQHRLAFPLFGLAINNIALLIFSLAGLFMIIVAKIREYRAGQHKQPSTLLLYIVIWYLLSLVEAGVASIPFLHYNLLVVPPLALLASWFLVKLYNDISNKQFQSNPRFIARIVLFFLLTTVLFLSTTQNFTYYYHYTQYKLGQESYQEFLLKGWSIAGKEVVRVQTLADYIKEHTEPDDYIYYWSIYPQVYYLADRRSPIDTVWPMYVDARGSHQQIFKPQTKYIIVDSNNKSRPKWLDTGLAENYTLETTIQEQEIYRRVD